LIAEQLSEAAHKFDGYISGDEQGILIRFIAT